MPAPSASLATLRPDLSESFEQFDLSMQMQGFIAAKLAPPLEVDKPFGNFGIIPVDQLLAQRSTARSPGGAYNRSNWTFTPATYTTKENGEEEVVDDNEAKMFDNYFVAERLAANRAREIVLRNLELRVAGLTGTASVYTSNGYTGAVGAGAWTTTATATPISDIEKGIQAVFTQSGLRANTVVLPWLAWRNFRQCSQVRDAIKYWGGDDPTAEGVTEAVIARLLDVDQVLVAGAVTNSANQGQSASLGTVWAAGRVFICRAARSSDPKEPCAIRIFHWAEDGSTIGTAVESYRDERVRSTVIRARMQTDEQALYAAAGYVLTGAI